MKKEYVYGFHAVELLLKQNPEDIAELLLLNPKNSHSLIKLAEQNSVSIKFLTRKELEAIVGGANHQGFVATLKKHVESKNESELFHIIETATTPITLLILDGVQDPHNLGACLRTADAANVAAVIIPKDNAVGLTATVRKVASGAAEIIPLIQVTNLARTIKDLKEHNIWIYGATHDAQEDIYAMKFDGSVALVLGAEGTGLRRLTRESCDFLFKIPMYGSVPNLNVSVAAGVCLYEVLRQKSYG